MSEESTRFWSHPDKWPEDAYGYVFLARAFREIGQTLFPDAWTGTEAYTPRPIALNEVLPDGRVIPLPRYLAKPYQLELAYNLLRTHRPDFGLGPIKRGPFGTFTIEFTAAQWMAAVAVADGIDAERGLAINRARESWRHISTACREGELVSVLRRVEGGAFGAPLESSLWNSERLGARYYWCQMNPASPFSPAVGGDGFQYIFVEREGLDRLIKKHQREREAHSRVIADTSRGGKRDKYRKAVRAIVEASPTSRTHSKTDFRQLGVEYGLSKRDADNLRDRVIDEFDAPTRTAWRKAGPTNRRTASNPKPANPKR